MCLLRRSLITWSPEFTSGDFIFNLVTAGSGVLEIGARQHNNWRLHEPPDFLPFCQPDVSSTRLYCSLVPRYHFRLPGRYKYQGETLKEYINRFGAQVVKVGTTEEPMIVYAFVKGICPDPFGESIIRNRPRTFAELRRRAVEHIASEGEVCVKRTSVVP